MIKKIRMLAENNTAGQLTGCLTAQLESGENACYRGEDAQRVTALLAKAAFVRSVVEEEAVSVNRALRVLGTRMRRLSG